MSDYDGLIAVVGMSGRFPGARDVNEFWKNLVDGRVSLTEFSADELRKEGIDPSRFEDPNYVRKGYVLDNIDMFDAAFFDINPREAEYIDPQQRLFLETAWESLEQAGHTADTNDLLVGMFGGASLSGYLVTYFAQNWTLRDLTSGMQIMCGNDKDYICTKTSYKLNLRGPSVNVQAACSTSLVAVCQAYESLVSHQCDLALAGGVTVRVPHRAGYLYDEGSLYSPDGYCRSFDKQAGGTVFGSGVGVVALRRYDDAIRDGDHIYAVIRGAAINNDGAVKIGFTAPSARGQAEVITTAQAIAGVEPESIQYIEAHGTGTHLGDPIEVSALTEVFRNSTRKKGFCAIGSVKSNVGHLEAAAGIAAFIKASMALKNGMIPPSLHYTQPNPQIDFDNSPFYVNTKATAWKRNGVARRAGVSAFGIGGTNAHVILEEAPPIERDPVLERGAELLVLSGKNEAALSEQIKRYRAHLTQQGALALGDICYTAGAGRSHFTHRLSVVAGEVAELTQQLAQLESGGSAALAQRGVMEEGRRPKVAFLCTGQGSQYAGMARELYAREPVFRAVLDRCDACLRNDLERPLLEVIFGADDGSLDKTGYTQPALYALEAGLAALWSAWGVTPDIVMGHSVGEYAAAHIAGVFGLEDGLKLIAARARLMQALPAGGGMAAVMASAERVQALLKGRESELSLAAINGSESVVVSGPSKTLQDLCTSLEGQGIKTRPLAVSHAFHSALMEPMLDAFRNIARGIAYQAPKLALISNVSGELAGAAMADADYWVRHVRAPVQFAAGVQTLMRSGATVCVEIGPKPVLLGMARACLPDETISWLPSLRPGQPEPRSLLESLGALYVRGATVDWRGVYAGRGYRKVVLPTYAFQRKRYWANASTTPQPGRARTQSGADRGVPHPLIGQRLQIAGSNQTRYENSISCASLAYLNDHRVFDRALFPATGYVEMAVASGQALNRALVLKDLQLQQPMLIPEDESVLLQCVLTPIDGGEYRFEAYSLPVAEENAEWVFHASGKLVAGSVERETAPVDLAELKRLCSKARHRDAYYRQFDERGIVYGPAFRTIHNLWSGDNQALAEIHLPDSVLLEVKNYRIHPAVLDACLQVVGAAFPEIGENITYLPMGIESVSVIGHPGGAIWVHAQTRQQVFNEPTLRADLIVFAENGERLASIQGLILARASRSAFAKINPQQLRRWLYQVEWKAQPLQGRRLSPDFLQAPLAIEKQLSTAFSEVLARFNLDGHSPAFVRIRKLVLVYIARALQQLGLSYEAGMRFTADELINRLAIVPRQRRQFLRLLAILEEFGVIARVDDAWVVRLAPNLDDPAAEINCLLQEYPDIEGLLTLLSDCGVVIAGMLSGDVDPLQIIFPQGSTAKATRLYTELPAAQAMNEMLRRSIQAALASMPAGRQLRILEIGAGTGGTTGFVLPYLPPDRTLYTYTDISHAFLGKAKERFGDYQFIDYRILNVELGPAAQGFGQHEFDIVVAANVLHATKDLRKSVKYAHWLLAPGGMLVMLEGTRPSLSVDLIFGWTDGWWRFEDSGLRDAHPLISPKQWRTVLTEIGFAQVGAFPAIDSDTVSEHDLSVILAQNSATRADHAGSGRQWMILDDAQSTGNCLIKLLESQGERCLRVRIGTRFAKTGERSIELRPGSEEDFQALHDLVLTSWKDLAGVVDLWGLHAGDAQIRTGEEMLDASEVAWGSALYLAKILSLQATARPPRLWLVTRGAQSAENDLSLSGLVQSPLSGLAKAVAMENPELRCTCIDLDPRTADGDAEMLAQEIWTSGAEDQIALRGQRRYVARLVRCALENAVVNQPAHSGTLEVNDAASGEPRIEFRKQASYLITGGLGGLGRTVARWMVERGAGRIVLVGRSSPDDAVQKELRQLRELGAEIVVARANVSDSEELARILSQTKNDDFPLRGVFHSAGILDDALLVHQDSKRFRRVLSSKVAGAWNLHYQTLDSELDMFVLFSSLASLLGSAGQANHSAANAFLDAIAHHRRTLGLPALSINWGAWAKVGSATDVTTTNLLFKGLEAIEPEQGIWIMEQLLLRDLAQVAVLSLDWSQAGSRNVTMPLLSELMQASNQLREAAGEFLQKLREAAVEDRIGLITAFVRTQLVNVLGLDSTAIVDSQQGLFDIGLDSLTAVEFRNRIQRGLNCTLSSTLAFNYPSIDAIVTYLRQSVLDVDIPVQEKDVTVSMVDPGIAALEHDLDDLSGEKLNQLLEDELEKIKQDA